MTGNEGSLVGQTLGVYRLRSLLGVGGMAEVYLAEDPSLRRDIAVKVLPRSLAADPGYVERFRNEAQRVASLSHPNITPVYTFGEERGLLYLVMPRMKESLRERMEREGQLPLQEAYRITNQIASALYIAHQHGIVHRDVKPENILLDEGGKAMLTDFGIARELSALRESGVARTLAATGLPVGTPEYMAPEQLRGQAATEQVDLYALGVVLYEMLTTHVPHDAATPYEVATAVLRDPPRPPSHYNDAITPQVEQVILAAMEKDPALRYPNMKAFALDLRSAITGQGKAMNSGALRWTHLAQPSSQAAEPRMGRSLASASSSLVLAPQIPLNDTTKRPTITHEEARRQGYAGLAQSQPRKRTSRRSVALLAGVAALVVVSLIGVGLKVTDAMGLFTSAVGSPSLTVHVATATPQPTVTATPAPTATATPAPTATPKIIYVVPTPPQPQPLSVAPNPVTFKTYYKSVCITSSPIIISNLDSSRVTWAWTAAQPSLASVSFSLNNSTWQSGLPRDTTGLAAYNGTTLATDSVQVKAACSAFNNGAQVTVTMTDSLNRTYTITLKMAG